jgi:AraC-like DNA-binding protein
MAQRLGTRVIIDLRRRGIASVPTFGRYNYNRANPALAEHQHPMAIEICYLERGRQNYSVGAEQFLMRGGDVFMIFPGETHGTGGAPEEKGLLYWMPVLEPSATGGRILDLPETQSRILWKQLIKRPRRHFAGTGKMKDDLHEIARLGVSPKTPLSRIKITNCLIGFLLELIAGRDHEPQSQENGSLAPILSYIRAHLEEPGRLRVANLASIAGLSESRFKASFKDRTGLPPAEFVLRERVAEAARRLAERHATVTEVAFSLGFSSSQYFASVFKRFTNRTPGSLLSR